MGNDLTLFSTCRPFTGKFAQIQHNAIASWERLNPQPFTILFGNEALEADGITYGPESNRISLPVERNDQGTPLVSSMWHEAELWAATWDYDLLCYVNADIILFDDFTSAVERVAREIDTFLMVGSRWDLSKRVPEVDFDKRGWQTELAVWAVEHGQRHPPSGSDYFVWRGDVWDEIPDFAVGRLGWDTWLMWTARMRGVPVVDATQCVLALHPPHKRPYKGVQSPEVKRNRALGKKDGSGAVKDASWVLTREELREK